MDEAFRWRLDAIIALLSVIAAGVIGIAWSGGALVAATTVFVLGALFIATIRRQPSQ